MRVKKNLKYSHLITIILFLAISCGSETRFVEEADKVPEISSFNKQSTEEQNEAFRDGLDSQNQADATASITEPDPNIDSRIDIEASPIVASQADNGASENQEKESASNSSESQGSPVSGEGEQNVEANPDSAPTEPTDKVEEANSGLVVEQVLDGLSGGHFDVDSFIDGKRVEHVHEFDDRYMTNGIIMHGNHNFDAGDSGLALDTGGVQQFKIKLINAQLSRGGFLSINDAVYNFENLPDEAQVYSLSPSDDDNIIHLKKLAVSFQLDAIESLNIRPSEPGCVKKDEPGPSNEKRNGAFTVEVLDVDNNIIWELSAYEHRGDCS